MKGSKSLDKQPKLPSSAKGHVGQHGGVVKSTQIALGESAIGLLVSLTRVYIGRSTLLFNTAVTTRHSGYTC